MAQHREAWGTHPDLKTTPILEQSLCHHGTNLDPLDSIK